MWVARIARRERKRWPSLIGAASVAVRGTREERKGKTHSNSNPPGSGKWERPVGGIKPGNREKAPDSGSWLPGSPGISYREAEVSGIKDLRSLSSKSEHAAQKNLLEREDPTEHRRGEMTAARCFWRGGFGMGAEAEARKVIMLFAIFFPTDHPTRSATRTK